MKNAERIVLLILFAILIGGGIWIYIAVQQNHQDVVDAVARGEYEIRDIDTTKEVSEENWQVIYPGTIPVLIGEVTVLASVADGLAERIKGLSNTPFLPENVVKLFAFGAAGSHSIWMKDMNYALDIIWVSKDGEIVHIEEDVSPDTFPTAFASPTPAWFVIEANSGFVSDNSISIGDAVVTEG